MNNDARTEDTASGPALLRSLLWEERGLFFLTIGLSLLGAVFEGGPGERQVGVDGGDEDGDRGAGGAQHVGEVGGVGHRPEAVQQGGGYRTGVAHPHQPDNPLFAEALQGAQVGAAVPVHAGEDEERLLRMASGAHREDGVRTTAVAHRRLGAHLEARVVQGMQRRDVTIEIEREWNDAEIFLARRVGHRAAYEVILRECREVSREGGEGGQ